MAKLSVVGKPAAVELYPPRTRGGLDPRRPGEMAERIERLRRAYLMHPANYGATHLEILDLEPIRQRLGRRWPELLPKILFNVEGCISHRLGPEDLYLVVDEVTVWILAVGGQPGEAERLGRLIAGDVTERLLGVLPGGAAVGVRSVPFDFAEGLKGVAGLLGLRERVAEANRRLAQAEERRFADHTDRLIALYRPILSLRQPAIVGYRVFARLTREDGTLEMPQTIAPEPSLGTFEAALDTWLAEQVAAVLDRSPGRGGPPPILIPVHLKTLGNRGWRERWQMALAHDAIKAAGRLAIEVIDLPAEAPRELLGELAATVRSCAGPLIVRRPLAPDAVLELAGLGVYGVSVNGEGLDPGDPKTARRLRVVADACRTSGLRSLMVRVGTPALAEQARAAGLGAMSGDACLPALREPGPVAQLEQV